MSETEEDLKRIFDGNTAREQLYRRARGEILPRLRGMIPQDLQAGWDAEDLFEETFLRAMESLPSFEWRGESSWHSFLITIAGNIVKDALKRKSRADVRFANGSTKFGYHGSRIPDSAPRPSEALSNLDAIDEVFSCMEEDEAKLIRLRYLEGLSAEEVASRTGKSVGATIKAIQRAMAKFASIGLRLLPRNRS